MPFVITDDFFGEHGGPTAGEVGYEDLPLAMVVSLALNGDDEAVAWLNANVGGDDGPADVPVAAPEETVTATEETVETVVEGLVAARAKLADRIVCPDCGRTFRSDRGFAMHRRLERLAAHTETFYEGQPRQEGGRFGEGKQDESEKSEADKIPPPSDPKARGPVIGEIMRREVAAGKDTETLHDKVDGRPGKYTAERETLHREIVDQFLQKSIDAGARKDQEAILLAGLPGAGKTSATQNLIITEGYVTISSDDIKFELAARGVFEVPPGVGRMEGAPLIHEESSKIAHDLSARASAEGYNVIFDFTMNDQKSLDGRMDQLTRSGHDYSTMGVFIGAPVEQAVEAAVGRYERGLARDPDTARYTPPGNIERNAEPPGSPYLSKNERTFDEQRDRFDRWIKIDNTGFKPCITAASAPELGKGDGLEAC